jgi:PPOX class probable F420-dependent enzyme
VTVSDLKEERYISLTTFKRDGTPVATPVWVVGQNGHLLVHTAAGSWKVKRIRRDSHVQVAPCSATGKVRAEGVDGEARILPDTALVEELEARKYGVMYRAVRVFSAIGRALRRQPVPESVTIEIAPPGELTPDAGSAVD